MNRQKANIVIEDDLNDQLLIKEAFIALNNPNEIVFRGNGQAALEFLTKGNKIRSAFCPTLTYRNLVALS